MELLKIWEDWARKNGYISLTQDGIIKTMVTEFCKHLESIPVEKRVSPTELTFTLGEVEDACNIYHSKALIDRLITGDKIDYKKHFDKVIEIVKQKR